MDEGTMAVLLTCMLNALAHMHEHVQLAVRVDGLVEPARSLPVLMRTTWITTSRVVGFTGEHDVALQEKVAVTVQINWRPGRKCSADEDLR